MMSTDFGVTADQDNIGCSPCKPEKPRGPSYPEVTFRDKHADQLIELIGGDWPEIDEKVTGRFTLRIKAVRKDEWGRSVEACIVAGDDIGSEEVEEEKPKGKKSKSEAPVKEGY